MDKSVKSLFAKCRVCLRYDTGYIARKSLACVIVKVFQIKSRRKRKDEQMKDEA